MIFKYSFQNCTSCSERAVPVSVRHPIVRVAASNASITTVVQVAEAPSRTNTRRRRFVIEASSQTPYNPKIILFANKTIKGLTAPSASHSPRFYPSRPGAPREPFQPAQDTPMFEPRQATPAIPPLSKRPKHQAARTPDAAGS